MSSNPEGSNYFSHFYKKDYSLYCRCALFLGPKQNVLNDLMTLFSKLGCFENIPIELSPSQAGNIRPGPNVIKLFTSVIYGFS